MNNIEIYKRELGLNIQKFLNMEIDFEVLMKNSSVVDQDIESDELIKKVWHIIYQYSLDIDTHDDAYAKGIKNCMREISDCLIHNSASLSQAIKNYFNNPLSSSDT